MMARSITDKEARDWFRANEQPPPNMHFEIVVMTPALAHQILSGNVDNRRVRRRAVDNAAKAIKRGEWKLTHQGIALASNGRLLDGQHRLMAIEQAGIAVPIVVAHNADPDTFDTLDMGIRRSVQDVVGGNRQVLQVASVLCRMLYTENDNSIQRVEEMHQAIAPIAERVTGAVTKLNRVNVAGIRAGVVLRATLGEQRYITDLWQGVVEQMTEALPPIGHAFLRRINQAPKRRGGVRPESENLCLGWELANIRRRDQTRFQTPVAAQVLPEMRQTLRAFLQGHGMDVPAAMASPDNEIEHAELPHQMEAHHAI